MRTHWLPTGGRLLYLLLTALPLLAGVGYALAYSLGLTGVLATGLTLDHWSAVLGNPAFWRTLAFSLWVALASIGLSLALALALVLRDHRSFLRGRLSYFIYLPLCIPAIVMAFFIFQMLGKGGWLSRLAWHLGLISGLEGFPDWVNDNYGIAIIAAHVCMATPFFTLLLANVYRNEQLADYLQLAASLGAGRAQAIRRVALPILLRRSLATVFLYFLFVLGSYEIPLLLGSQSVQMVSVRTIQRLQRFNLGDIPEAYAICVAYTVMVAGLLSLLLLWNRRQLHRV